MKRILLSAGVILLLAGIATGAGKIVGKIGNIDARTKEVTVNLKSGINLNMGELLEIRTENGNINLVVTFPMQTIARCKIKGDGKLSDLSKGMEVCRYSKEAEQVPAAKAGDTVKFGDTEIVFIEGGTYTMGSPENENERGVDENQHKVTISSFWMSRFEVTQKEYSEVTGTNPSSFSGDNLPVEQISWYDAVEYCNKLSEKHGLKPFYKIDKNKKDPNNRDSGDTLKYTVKILGGDGFRLPTEAEWEYACRGGTTTAFHYGDSLASTMANFHGGYPYNADSGVSREKTTPVGYFKPNAYGLYDMHGNVYEWCWDWHGAYGEAVSDPMGPISGDGRIVRGGSWYIWGRSLRSAYRLKYKPSLRENIIGMRVVRSGF